MTNLLNNWAKATIDCTYADVPRELLSQKNKEELLEKAKTSALFDKSASVVSCKRSNKIVRDYIGVTGKGPLVNIDKLILKRDLVEYYVNGDKLDDHCTVFVSFDSQSKDFYIIPSLHVVVMIGDMFLTLIGIFITHTMRANLQ